MNCKRALRVAAMVSVMMCTLRIGEAQPGASEPGGDRLGGHIGFVLPLVTHAGGQTTTLDENFGIGFPVGITVKSSGVRPSILSLFRSYKTRPGRFLLPSIQDSCMVLGTASPPWRA